MMVYAKKYFFNIYVYCVNMGERKIERDREKREREEREREDKAREGMSERGES